LLVFPLSFLPPALSRSGPKGKKKREEARGRGTQNSFVFFPLEKAKTRKQKLKNIFLQNLTKNLNLFRPRYMNPFEAINYGVIDRVLAPDEAQARALVTGTSWAEKQAQDRKQREDKERREKEDAEREEREAKAKKE
jgi:hypothetical protein